MSSHKITGQRPKIPDELLRVTYFDLTKYVFWMFFWWLAPAAFSYYILISGESLLVKIIVATVAGYLSGTGLARAQWLGHDAGHGGYPPNKFISLACTSFMASAMPLYFNTAFAAYHHQHHAQVNGPEDPDVVHYSKYNTWAGRLFLVRLAKNREYMVNSIKILAEGKTFLGFDRGQSRRLVLLNFVFVVFWLSVYTYLAMRDINLFLAVIGIPIITLSIGTGCLTYQQHADTGKFKNTDIWLNARSLSGKFWTFLYTGGNFHLEHHLYPRVPVWNLAKVHDYLKAQGYLTDERISIDRSWFLGGYKYFSPKHKYPDGKE